MPSGNQCWAVGPGRLTLNDIALLELVKVSRGSWQAEFVVNTKVRFKNISSPTPLTSRRLDFVPISVNPATDTLYNTLRLHVFAQRYFLETGEGWRRDLQDGGTR